MKQADAIVIGGGIIGLSLALRLRDSYRSVLVLERHEPASEATFAAGGMIANCDPHTPETLQSLADASAAMFPDFVRELEAESGETIDLRDAGTIAQFSGEDAPRHGAVRKLTTTDLKRLEPSLHLTGAAWLLPELCVDPRGLAKALLKACRKRGVDFATGSEATEVLTAGGRTIGVRTTHASYHSPIVANCAGAWAAKILPLGIPTRPVKGQMVCVVPQAGVAHDGPLIKHVVRTPEVYIIPRSDGRILLGATVEEAGFDKKVNPMTVQQLYQAGVKLAPALSNTRIHDAWAGLRPGSPDDLPILGETSILGYFAATGHYRDGIMLAPVTATVMSELISGAKPQLELAAFSPLRFA